MTSPPTSPASEQAPAQAAQAGLALLISTAISKLWPSLDLLNLRQSLPAFKAAVAVEVQRHAQASATLAGRQYRQQRVAAGVGGGFTPAPARPPTVQQIAQAVDWAVQPLWDSSIPVSTFPGAPQETIQVAGSAIADAKARVAAASEKLVLDVGRDTVIGNVQRDRQAKGWARIPELGACHFCALLATRGAVYRTEKSASFKSHDNCRCHVEPVFSAYEPTAQIRKWQSLYNSVAAPLTDSADKRRAFRQAFEGREVTAGKGKPRQPAPSSSKTGAKAQPTGGRSVEQVRAELAALEKNLSRLTSDQQREWTSKRLVALRQQLGDNSEGPQA